MSGPTARPRAAPGTSSPPRADRPAARIASAGDRLARGVAPDEAQGALPGVVGRIRELLGLAVEEAVRGARVDDRLVALAGLVERGVELVPDALRDALVGATVDQEQVALDLLRDVRRGRGAGPVRAGRPAVERNRAGEAEA